MVELSGIVGGWRKLVEPGVVSCSQQQTLNIVIMCAETGAVCEHVQSTSTGKETKTFIVS